MSDFELQALVLSLKVATWSTAASLPLAILAAWALARWRFPGKFLFDGILHLPLVLPPVVIGYLLLHLFGRAGPAGAFLHEKLGIEIAFTWRGAAIAAAVIAFPLMVRAIRLSVEAVDRKLEQAARTLGASPVKAFATISLPLMAPGIVTGAILSFARALGEFGATITFVANIPGETQTLPLALYTAIQTPGGEPAAIRLMSISIAVALGAMLIAELLSRRLSARWGAHGDA